MNPSNAVMSGQPQTQGGANGLITQTFGIGAPSIYALTAGVFAPQCVYIQIDSTTGYKPIAFLNTGTAAAPAWTQQGSSKIIAAGGTLTLTAAQSGSIILLNTASGSVVTLPAPVIGLTFTFVISTTVTSNSHKIVTDASTTFMYGCLALMEAAATSAVGCLGNGSSHVAITMNGTTTGGILGTRIICECTAATLWETSGIVAGSGSLSTPYATS